MPEIICTTPLLAPGETKPLSFWDILLDERWASDILTCPDEVYCEVGYLNQRLRAKQTYEFLLRAAENYPITAKGSNDIPSFAEDTWECFRTDCYIVGKYQDILREHGYFEAIVTGLIQQTMQMTAKDDGFALLEEMISRAPSFYEIDDNTQPFLLYYGADACQNLLNHFIDSLATELSLCHQRVELFNGNAEGTASLTRYIGRRFKAIIGMQSGIFALKMQDQCSYLHDYIYGPKYNMIFDHPAWFKNDLVSPPKDYHLLLHDRNYINFAQNYFTDISGCVHLPPGGFVPDTPYISMENRAFDVSFIATYRDYRNILTSLYSSNRLYRHLAARYFRIVRSSPDYTGEQALEHALKHFGIPTDQEQFLKLFYDMRPVYFCALLYYRERIVASLLDAGIHVHVFGDSWYNSPFQNIPYLTIHPEVDAKQSLEIMQNSKISLNIMSWHKDGQTERVFNSMLSQSVVVSDTTTALEAEFQDEQDIILFSLKEISSLPIRLKTLLNDERKLQKIAANGYQKALSCHTWKERAQKLLHILDNGE